MLGCFLHKRKQDEAEELIWYPGFDDIFNAFDQEESEERDNCEREDKRYNAFSEGKLRLCKIFVVIKIPMLIGFKDFIEDGVLRAGVVPDEAIFVSTLCYLKILDD